MIASLLISFREVIEATLIIFTVLGLLTKLKQIALIKTVWQATGAAILTSVLLLLLGSSIGLKIQQLYSGTTEDLIEGVLMIISAMFITWAVFFLHNTFRNYKVTLLSKINETVSTGQKKAIFTLVFTAVFREGFEIVLFLSTLYLSHNPLEIFSGFLAGSILGILACLIIFKTTISIPIKYAFTFTSVLLVLFAGGLLSRGVHELMEAQIIPAILNINIAFLPDKSTLAGSLLKILFGITQHMDALQISLYGYYILIMSIWIRKQNQVENTA